MSGILTFPSISGQFSLVSQSKFIFKALGFLCEDKDHFFLVYCFKSSFLTSAINFLKVLEVFLFIVQVLVFSDFENNMF